MQGTFVFCTIFSGSTGKEIYLPTAKIAPSFRNFLTPCVPVANRRVVGVVVPRTTPFDTVRTRRRAEPCRFCRKIPFFLETSRKSTKTSFSKCSFTFYFLSTVQDFAPVIIHCCRCILKGWISVLCKGWFIFKCIYLKENFFAFFFFHFQVIVFFDPGFKGT